MISVEISASIERWLPFPSLCYDFLPTVCKILYLRENIFSFFFKTGELHCDDPQISPSIHTMFNHAYENEDNESANHLKYNRIFQIVNVY